MRVPEIRRPQRVPSSRSQPIFPQPAHLPAASRHFRGILRPFRLHLRGCAWRALGGLGAQKARTWGCLRLPAPAPRGPRLCLCLCLCICSCMSFRACVPGSRRTTRGCCGASVRTAPQLSSSPRRRLSGLLRYGEVERYFPGGEEVGKDAPRFVCPSSSHPNLSVGLGRRKGSERLL